MNLWSEANSRRPGRAGLVLAVLVLSAAAGLRFWQLGATPPGLTHDEANNVHDAAAVLDGVRPFFFPVAQGKEPLYLYNVAAWMALLGRSPWVMRLTSAVWGLILVTAAYGWATRAFGTAVGLATAAGLAVGFWPVATSRLGLRAITLPGLFVVAVLLLWLGMDGGETKSDAGDRPSRAAVVMFPLAGLALGGCMYTYLAARLLPAGLILFWLYLFLFHRLVWRRHWRGFLALMMVAAAVAAPLLRYLEAHPAAEIRIGQLNQPLQALLQGDPGPVLDRAWQTVQMISFRGDTFIPYTIPGKPLLDSVMSVFFYGGLLVALARWRRPAYALSLLWLGVGFAPAMLTGVEAANLRAIAAQPVVYLLAAIGLVEFGRFGHIRLERSPWLPAAFKAQVGWILALAATGLYLVVGVRTASDYFVTWARDRDVRVHYHVDLAALAAVVRDHPAQAILVSALYPGQYHDPRVVEAELGGIDGRLRWFDGRGGFVIPALRDAIVIMPAGVLLHPALDSLLGPELGVAERVHFGPNDLVSGLDVSRWRGAPADASRPLAALGDELTLLRAWVDPAPFSPGAVATVVTHWQIAGRLPDDRDGVLFAQVLDPAGQIVAQQDRLDVPSWNWHVGDQFLQVFSLGLPTDLPPGHYRLILGAYTVPDRVDAVLDGHEPDPTMPRLPVLIDGQHQGDFYPLDRLVVEDAE